MTIKYHYKPTGMAKIQNIDNTKNWLECGTMIFIHYWWECKIVIYFRRHFGRFKTKLNILIPFDPAVILFGIYPNELKTCIHTKTCTHMLIAALLNICKNLKATDVSFNRCMDKHTVLSPGNEIILSAKKKWAIKPWKDVGEP